MPVTALLMDGNKLKFSTIPGPVKGSVTCKMFMCDDNWAEITLLTVATKKNEDQIEMHKAVRTEAIEKGHFVPEQSTNPELNQQFYAEEE